MANIFKIIGLSVVIVGGFCAILATSQMPPASLYIKSGEDHYGGADLCPGQEITIAWYVNQPAEAYLVADPLETVEPRLDKLPVNETGEVKVKILANAIIRLDVANGTASDLNSYSPELTLNLMDSEVCSTFGQNPLGSYRGNLQQKLPTEEVLERGLMLYWQTDLGLSAIFFEPDEYGGYSNEWLELLCSVEKETVSMTCQTADKETMILKGTITAEGYMGSYNGQSNNIDLKTPFSGIFSFSKISETNP